MTGIGPRLRQERHRLKLSQSALGAVGGVETNAQGNYENGTRWPKADYLLRLAEAGVDITYLLTGVRPPEGAAADALTTRNAAQEGQLEKASQQLRDHLHGLIDALYEMTLLIELRVTDTRDDTEKTQLNTIRTEAQALAQAMVRFIFVSSKLA